MKNNKSFFGLFLAVLVLLPGCMRVPTYKPRSLQSVADHCAYHGTENNVTMRAKKLNQMEKNYLFCDRLLVDTDLQVIYISMHNLSNRSYVFSHSDIYAKHINNGNSVRLMRKTSSVGRLAGAALFAYPSLPIVAGFAIVGTSSSEILPITIACCGPLVTGGMLGFLVGVCLVGSVVSLAFLANGIKSIVMNRRISKDLAEKVLHKKVIINSGEHYEGLIFVKSSDYTPQFIVTMHDKKKKKNSVTFDIDLRQNEQQT